MTASQPELGLELQQRPRTVEQQPRGDAGFRDAYRDQRRRSSLQIEPAPLLAEDGPEPSLGPRTQHATWTSNASSTTVGPVHSPSGTIPRWPFEETDELKEEGAELHGRPESKDSRAPPQPGRRRGQPAVAPRPIHSRHVLSYWALEILTVFVAIALLVAIVALLAHYDGHFMPEWPFDINLNSAIAFLTTFLRAAIVAAVAEIIGQIKWTWFTERTRPLHHLQDFDSASRSVLGSIRLVAVVVWNCGFTTAGLLGLAAAAVTIASLAVGPVTQQALRTGTCPQLLRGARAAMPAANFVPGSSAYYRVGAGSYELEVDMKSTLIQGLTDPGGRDAAVDVVCSSGNCTWPDWGTGVTHASVGLCSACLDTTDFVAPPDAGGNLTLPDEGAFINYNPGGAYMWVGYSNLSAYARLFSESFSTAAAVSVMNFSMLAASTAPCNTTTDAATGAVVRACPHRISQSNNTYFANLGDYVAASCVLYPCMKEYAARYENNVLTEKVVRTTTAVPNLEETTDSYYAASSFYANYTATRSPCVLDNGTWYTYENQSAAPRVPGRTWANISLASDLRGDRNISVPNACLYKMDGIFASALAGFLSSTLLSARCTYDDAQAGHIDCGDAWWLTPLWGQMDATYASLDARVRGLATAVTNKFRATGLGPDAHLGTGGSSTGATGATGAGGSNSRALVYGRVYESTTCTYFDRGWIALPAVLVLACVLLLAWIAVKNYRDPEQPVWKGSVLPLLFFGLHAPGQQTATAGGSSCGGGVVGGSSRGSGPGTRLEVPGAGGGGGGDDNGISSRDRLERNATFFRENGRAAPELDRIQEEAGRTWVRFHGGTDPGFVDLGTVGRRGNQGGGGHLGGVGDAEASLEQLVAVGDKRARRETRWPDYQTKGFGRFGRRSSA